MPSVLAMDWQVARQLKIRVLGVVMKVGFTESKDVGFVLVHKCFKICYSKTRKPQKIMKYIKYCDVNFYLPCKIHRKKWVSDRTKKTQLAVER